MTIYTSQQLDPIFESLKTMDLKPAPHQLIDLFVDEPWNKGMSGYTRETKDRESWIANISKAKIGKESTFKGKTHSDESKEKNRQKHLGKKLTKEHKQNIAKSKIGSKHSEETKNKISKSCANKSSPLKGINRSDNVRTKIAEGKRGKKRHYREDGSFYMA